MDARGRGRRGSDVEGANDARARRGGDAAGVASGGGGLASGSSTRPERSRRGASAPREGTRSAGSGVEREGARRRAGGRTRATSSRLPARFGLDRRHRPGSRPARAAWCGRPRGDEGGCRREIQIWLVRDCGRQQQHSRPRSSRASHEPTRVKSTRAPSRARSGRTRSARARTPGGFERARAPSELGVVPSLGSRARAGRARGVVARGRPEATRRSLPRRAFLGNARSRDDVRGSPPPPVDPRHAARLRSSPDGYARVARLALEPRARGRGRGRGRRRRRRRSTRSAANDPGASVPATGPAPGHRFGRPRLEQPPLAPGDHRLARQPFFVSFPSRRRRRPLRARSLPLPSPAPSLTPHPPQTPPLSSFPSSRDFPRRGRGDPRGVRARPRRPALRPAGSRGRSRGRSPREGRRPLSTLPIKRTPPRGHHRRRSRSAPSRDPRTRPRRRNAFERAPRPRGGSLLGSVGLFRFPSLGKSAAAFRRRRFFAPLRRSPQPLRVLGGIVLPSPLSALQRERRLQ